MQITRVSNTARKLVNLNKTSILKSSRFESTKQGLDVEKPKSGFFGKAIGFTLLLSLAYSGTVYYAAHDEQFKQTYLKYAPLGKETLEYVTDVEKELGKDNPDLTKVFKEKLQSLTDYFKIDSTKSGPSEAEIQAALEKKRQEELKKLKSTVAQQMKIIEEFEKNKLELLNSGFSKLDTGSDKTIENIIKSINDFVTSTAGPGRDVSDDIVEIYAKLLSSLKNLGPHLVELKEEGETKLKKHQEASSLIITEVLAKKSKQDEIEKKSAIDEARNKFNLEKEQLISTFRDELENKLKQQAEGLERWWRRESRLLVDNERNNRLSKLNLALQQLQLLEDVVMKSVDRKLLDFQLNELNSAVDAIKLSVLNPYASYKPFINELRYLQKVSTSFPLSQSVVSTLNVNTARSGLPSLNDLKKRFTSLKDEVRAAALVQNEAGFVGHLTSYALSYLMFKKEGNVSGDDIEAILSRTEYHLNLNDLDSATREANQLKGWPKKLAQDWISEAISKLEYEQAVQVLSAEVRLVNLSQLI